MLCHILPTAVLWMIFFHYMDTSQANHDGAQASSLEDLALSFSQHQSTFAHVVQQLVNQRLVTIARPAYQGCFQDFPSPNRVLKHRDGNNSLTRSECEQRAVAREMEYYGLQYYQGTGGDRNTGQCWYGTADLTQETIVLTCVKDNHGEYLGGRYTNAIYATPSLLGEDSTTVDSIELVPVPNATIVQDEPEEVEEVEDDWMFDNAGIKQKGSWIILVLLYSLAYI